MDLPTIEMDVNAARQQYLVYRGELRYKYAEDEWLKRMYRQLSQGKRIVNIREAIAAGGWHDDGLPKLAFARADEQFCFCERLYERIVFTPRDSRIWGRGHIRAKDRVFEFDAPRVRNRGGGRSVVPLIPPGLRPDAALDRYHILWEADWKQVPADPALLKHLGGDMYAVVAVWDLTEIERMALGMRRA